MADEKAAKLKALQLTLDKLDKTYGKGSVMKLGDEAVEEVEAISSGSIGLDIALGGGYPRGCGRNLWTRISGKTTLTLHAIAECQRQGGIAVLLMQNMLLTVLCRKIGGRYFRINHLATRSRRASPRNGR